MTPQFICPKPKRWNEVYRKLKEAGAASGAPGAPPVPLVLGAWWASSDADKATRWEETVAWAEERCLTHLIPAWGPDDMYTGGDG